jgi:hypothetical protein
MAILMPRAAEARLRRRGTTVGALAVPLLLLALSVMALGYVAYVLWPRWPDVAIAPDAPTLPITISGLTFNIPPNAVRVAVQRHPGPHERVDLVFLWPSLTPPERDGAREATAAASTDRIFVTVAESGGGLSPPERLTVIYPRYAAGKPSIGDDGLAEMKFRDGTPYQGEDLVYNPAAPEKFLARCNRSRNLLTPASCLFERFVGAASVTVRFPRDWLSDWRLVETGIERLIDQLRGKTG